MLKKFLPMMVLSLLLVGCKSTLTNLSARQQPRNPNNFYPVEVDFKSTQQSLLWNTIEPYIKVGDQMLPMRPTPLMTNRWEGLIPVPPDTAAVNYQYKFIFHYYKLGTLQTDSVLSHKYTLKVKDP